MMRLPNGGMNSNVRICSPSRPEAFSEFLWRVAGGSAHQCAALRGTDHSHSVIGAEHFAGAVDGNAVTGELGEPTERWKAELPPTCRTQAQASCRKEARVLASEHSVRASWTEPARQI